MADGDANFAVAAFVALVFACAFALRGGHVREGMEAAFVQVGVVRNAGRRFRAALMGRRVGSLWRYHILVEKGARHEVTASGRSCSAGCPELWTGDRVYVPALGDAAVVVLEDVSSTIPTPGGDLTVWRTA